MDQGVFKLLNTTVKLASSTTELGDAHKIYPNNITIRIERGFNTPPNRAGSNYSEKPREAGDPTIEIDLEFPEKNDTNNDYFADWESQNAKKMIIEVTGSTISGKSTAYGLVFYFPLLEIAEDPKYTLDGIIPVSLKLTALKRSTTPGDMDEAVPYMTLTNEVAALTGYPAESTS
jgi:hypothetical protein